MTEEEQVVEQCFDDETVGENCDDCIAHPSNKPEFECCFGTKHEWHDSTCRQCEYENRCSRLTHGTTPAKRRVVVRSRSKPSPFYGAPKHKDGEPKPLLPDEIVETPGNRTSGQQRQEELEEPFIKRLIHVAGWGMIEGGLQMALSHFQKNRPK